MAVEIPVKTKYDGRGVDQAEKDLKRLQQEQIKATRQQIAEHRKVTQLTAKLDKDLAATQQARIKQYKEFGAAAATAGGIIVGFSLKAISDAREAMAAEAQLAAAIQSTGGAAGQSLEALRANASALQDITNFADEAIQGGQALLLGFEKIKEVFPEATAVMLDMAERMGKDVPEAAMQLGKILNIPTEAAGKLKKLGIELTEQQQEQIKAFVEGGRTADAQRIILDELQKTYGGAAQAARDAAGPQKDLEVATGELSEAWGRLLNNIGDAGVTGALVKFMNLLAEGADAWSATIERIQELMKIMDGLKIEYNLNLESFTLMAHGLAELNPFVILKNGIEGFYDALREGGGIFEAWRAGIEDMVSGLGDLISGSLAGLTNAQAEAAPAAAPAAGFQHGGSFTVGGFGGPDSQMVRFLATPGERVTVMPPGQGGGVININVNGPGGRELAAILERKVHEGIDEYHNEVIIPWSNSR